MPEQPQFRQVTVADGLPSSATTGLAFDRDGYLWIGTADGLARFDGLAYRVFRHVPGESGALPGNSITALHAASDGRLWVGVEGHGISVLDPARGEFHHLDRHVYPLLRSDDIWAIAGTRDGAVWFGSYAGGLYRLEHAGAAGERLSRYLPLAGDPRSLPGSTVLALATDRDGQLWIGTDAGLARWTGRDFERVPAAALSGRTVLSLSAERDGRLWIGTDGGLDLRLPDGRIEPPAWRAQLPNPAVVAVLGDRAGTHWIATTRGLARERDGVVRPLSSAAAHVAMVAAVEDVDGGLWFASSDRGLLRLPAGWRQFGFLGGSDGAAALPFGARAMAPARDGRVWLVDAHGGLRRFDPGSGVIETLLDGEAFPDHLLLSVLERQDGSVWVGHQQGLSRFDPVTRELRHWRSSDRDEPLLAGPINRLAETADGLLWLTSYGSGVQARDADGRLVQSINAKEDRGLDSPEQRQLTAGPDGTLWIAGPEGLRRWNAKTHRFDGVPGAPAEPVFGFAFVPPDTLWLHRMDALDAYRWTGVALERFRSVTSDQGLPAVESGGIASDRSGALWLTTRRGLLRYDPIGERLRLYGVRDGLRSQEFDLRAPLVLPDGLGLATIGTGVALFDPARMRSDARAASLVLDSVSLRRGEDVVELPRAAERQVMAPADRDLRVSARLLSFADPGAHRFRFWLHNYDPDWVEVGAAGERVFSRLDPGRYRLDVIAADADGRWSAPRGFDLQVQPPWWRTGAAKASAFLSALAVLWLLAHAYRQRLRLRQTEALREQRRQLVEQGSEAKSRFLATLGHEIRTPMTGVLGMSELLLRGELGERQRDQVAAIQRAGEHLLRLVNDALDLARIEAGKLVLDEAPFDLPALLDEVAALLRPLAEAKGLAFSLQRAPDTPRGLRGDGHRLRQILLNLGNNAIKFTERGEVALRSAALQPDGVVLEVSDTGPGMNAEQQARLFQRFEQAEGARTAARYGGSGLGLAICRELAAAMGGRIELHSAPQAGSTFRVFLPLPRATPDAAPAGAPAAIVAAPSRRILLVEDDATVADVVSGLLASLGHSVVHAAHGLAALAELGSASFDLVFVDLDLPGIDGLELARLVRAQGHTLPLVALTARADADAEALSLAAGMQGFLRKPVTRQMLAQAVQAALA